MAATAMLSYPKIKPQTGQDSMNLVSWAEKFDLPYLRRGCTISNCQQNWTLGAMQHQLYCTAEVAESLAGQAIDAEVASGSKMGAVYRYRQKTSSFITRFGQGGLRLP
jgi:hypothetical protein